MSSRASRSSSHDLVTFSQPPVGEVALAVQFDREVVDVEVLASFTAAVKKDLPVVQRQPMLPPMSERFDVLPQVPPFDVRFEPGIALPRTWFISADSSFLIQLQGDRIALNWRLTDPSMRYPRYERLRREFIRYQRVLEECVRETGGRPALVANASEVTYVNNIEPGGRIRGGGHPDLGLVLDLLKPWRRKRFLPPPEDAQLQVRWRIPAEELGLKEPAGRLYLTATPGLRPPNAEPIYIVNMTGRIVMTAGNMEFAQRALDVAHRWVVLGFDELTTSRMHQAWGRKEG